LLSSFPPPLLAGVRGLKGFGVVGEFFSFFLFSYNLEKEKYYLGHKLLI